MCFGVRAAPCFALALALGGGCAGPTAAAPAAGGADTGDAPADTGEAPPEVGVVPPEWPACEQLQAPYELGNAPDAMAAFAHSGIDQLRLRTGTAWAVSAAEEGCPSLVDEAGTLRVSGECVTAAGAHYTGAFTLTEAESSWSLDAQAFGFEQVDADAERRFWADGAWSIVAHGTAQELDATHGDAWLVDSLDPGGPVGRRVDDSDFLCADGECHPDGYVRYDEIYDMAGDLCFTAAFAGGELPRAPESGVVRLVGDVPVELRLTAGAAWWASFDGGSWRRVN